MIPMPSFSGANSTMPMYMPVPMPMMAMPQQMMYMMPNMAMPMSMPMTMPMAMPMAMPNACFQPNPFMTPATTQQSNPAVNVVPSKKPDAQKQIAQETSVPATQRMRCRYCREFGHKAVHCPKNPEWCGETAGLCVLHNRIRSVSNLRPYGDKPGQMCCTERAPCRRVGPMAAIDDHHTVEVPVPHPHTEVPVNNSFADVFSGAARKTNVASVNPTTPEEALLASIIEDLSGSDHCSSDDE
eukprot:PhM_4_TR14238/c0_g1_i3/m.12399